MTSSMASQFKTLVLEYKKTRSLGTLMAAYAIASLAGPTELFDEFRVMVDRDKALDEEPPQLIRAEIPQ